MNTILYAWITLFLITWIIIIVVILFVDREEELRALRDRLDSSGFELIVIYGRRIGKTRLINKTKKN